MTNLVMKITLSLYFFIPTFLLSSPVQQKKSPSTDLLGYIQTLSTSQRQELESIKNNASLTKAQIQENIDEFMSGLPDNLKNSFNKVKENIQFLKFAISQKVDNALNGLSDEAKTMFKNIQDIKSNMNITPKQEKEQIQNVLDDASDQAKSELESNEPSTSIERIDIDHEILAYFLKKNSYFIKEIHVWKSAFIVLKEIRSSEIKKIKWLHNDNFLYDDIIEEFMRIVVENSEKIKNLEIDYALLNFVPFYRLQLEKLIIPNFGGTLNESFLKEINTQSLVLREAANLCQSNDCLACENKCEFSINWDIKQFTVEFSRHLTEEFRYLLNIAELLAELPIHFPNLKTFDFVAEQEAIVDGTLHPMASMNEFRRVIQRYEMAMEYFTPTKPFDFHIHILCFCRPQRTQRFALIELLRDFETKTLTEDDRNQYVWRKLEKIFSSDQKRMPIQLDRDLLKEIAINFMSSPKLTREFTWQNNQGFRLGLINRNCQRAVIATLRSFPILDFLGAYKCVYLSLCYDGLGLETPSASQTTIPMNVDHCIIAPINIEMLKYLFKNHFIFVKKFFLAFAAWKEQVLEVLKRISLIGLNHLACHVRAVRTEYGYYGKEISRILLENSNTLKRLDVARYFCDSIPYFDLNLNEMNITFSHYQNSKYGLDQLVAQNLRSKSLTLNTEWKNVGTNWIMFSDFFQHVTVEEIRLGTNTFIYQKNPQKLSPNPYVKRIYIQFESFFHMQLEEFFEDLGQNFPNLELLYIMPDISDRHTFLNVLVELARFKWEQYYSFRSEYSYPYSLSKKGQLPMIYASSVKDVCLKKVSNLTENYHRTLYQYANNYFQITIDVMGVFNVDNKPLEEKLYRVPYGFERKPLSDEERAKNYRFSFGREFQIETNKTLVSKVLIY